MTPPIPLEVVPSAFAGLIGVARRDTTPPAGIYARMWGAAKHDVADGVHRPLSVTVLALQAREHGRPRLLVGLDIALLGDLGGAADSNRVLDPVRQALGLEPGELLVNCSHTHSAPWAAMSRSDMPGGELIGPYLDQLSRAILEAGEEALAGIAPATLTWATGRCDLARNRDLPDPASDDGRIVCGFNPAAAADDTLVVGRVTADDDGRVVGTIVNYACHPTTLAWENTLISPDYIGAMRELVEQHTGGAPCLFLHGASGELGPAHQYVGDPAVADQHGRRLGFSALAALEGMLPAGRALRYDGVVESGAPLAVWLPCAVRALARACRRGRRRAAAAEADADGGGARGAAGGHGRPSDRGAALPQDPDPAQPERRRPRGLPRLGLARRRQPRRRAGQRGVLVLPGGPQAGIPGHGGRGHEHERGRDGLPLPARARRPGRLPGLADAVREGGTAHPDRALHRGG